MVTNPNLFDAGIWILQIVIGFVCMAMYRKTGALILVVSVMCFLIGGLIILTGYDVAFYTSTNPTNMTITEVNGTHTTTITYHNIVPSNSTNYLIGNGQFPEKGTGQLWMGYGLLLLSIVTAIIFLDQTLKGNLLKGD